MTRIIGDFRRTDGVVKPMHGVGNAPLLGTDDKLFHFLGEAGIPYSRLHDIRRSVRRGLLRGRP